LQVGLHGAGLLAFQRVSCLGWVTSLDQFGELAEGFARSESIQFVVDIRDQSMPTIHGETMPPTHPT
jgi:hypothetical protein